MYQRTAKAGPASWKFERNTAYTKNILVTFGPRKIKYCHYCPLYLQCS